MQIALIIPAYEPEDGLIAQLHTLSQAGRFAAILVVNDGSSPRFDGVFEQAGRIQGVQVIRHAANAGKGAALKTGFRYAMEHCPKLSGAVMADADGQHLSHDILKVAGRLAERPGSVVLGVRGFEGDVPWRSRVGNRAARFAVACLTRRNVQDTQTGLRGLPASLLPVLLELPSNGYEFELEMLLHIEVRASSLEQVSIQTVYDAGNKSSHFRPLRDSLKIFGVLLRFYYSWFIVFAVLALFAIAVFGFATSPLFSQTIWFPEGLRGAERFLLAFAAVVIPVLTFAPKYFLPSILATLLAGTVAAVGPFALFAVFLFVYSAAVIGKTIFKEIDWILAFLTGTAVLIALEEMLVRLPWNYANTYTVLLLIPAALSPKLARSSVKAAKALLRTSGLTSVGERAGAGMLAMILTANWLMVMKPEVSADGLAMHLAIADGIAWKHRFAFDITHNIWAAMPMGGDWCYTLVYLLGGEFAARLLNLSFLLVSVAILWSTCRRIAGSGAALWISTLFAATPLVQLVTGSSFIENILAAVLFGGVRSLQCFEQSGRKLYAYAAAFLFGTALHIKFGSFAFVLPGIILLAWEIRRKVSRPLWTSLRIAALGLAAGAPPYMWAAVTTGNPIYPFLNTLFHSPLLAKGASVDETRFHEPLRASTLFDLTFHTSRFYEGQDGSFGLQYLLLIPVGLLFVRRRAYVEWSATVIGLSGCALILVSQPNVRYLYPALPLLHVSLASLWAGVTEQADWLRRWVLIAFAACLGFDLFLFPSSSWYHKDFYSAPLLTAQGRRLYLEHYEPRRLLIDDLNRRHPGEAVFLPSDSAIAGIHAAAFRDHWHDQATKAQLDEAHDGDEVLEYMRRWNVQRFLTPSKMSGILSRPVREFARACIASDTRVDDYFSGYIDAGCNQKVQELRMRLDKLSESGHVYDDVNPNLKLAGKWVIGDKFILASGETLTYSNFPGASLRFSFQGTGVSYVYTAAANRGIARLTLDGVPMSDLDCYRSKTRWQSLATFEGLKSGGHTIEISVTGRKNQDSSGSYVDLDAFAVK